MKGQKSDVCHIHIPYILLFRLDLWDYSMQPWLAFLFLIGEDEEAGAPEFTGGDCEIWSVLYRPVGETHFPQLG